MNVEYQCRSSDVHEHSSRGHVRTDASVGGSVGHKSHRKGSQKGDCRGVGLESPIELPDLLSI
jgi:hypothetical protein